MLPGNGTPRAGVSGTGVHETPIEYCGHGGAGGTIAPTAWSCCASCLELGKRIGFADAAPVQASNAAAATAADIAPARVLLSLATPASAARGQTSALLQNDLGQAPAGPQV